MISPISTCTYSSGVREITRRDIVSLLYIEDENYDY
jgi:hypothetical protein